jgi:hypothetical protein
MTPVTGIATSAGVGLQHVEEWGGTVTFDPDVRTCFYTHLDLTTEQLGRTRRYNCWGFTFLPRRYWINSSDDVDHILKDNCVPVADGKLLPGDVIRYRDDNNITTHTGRVWQVDAHGRCLTVRSKWGGLAEYIHKPLEVPSIYGINLAYFRQIYPLKGIGDLWIKDSISDTGEQYSAAQWASPDINVDAPPYGGEDVSPVFGQVNRVWTVVRNRSNKTIQNVIVRYYWTDPSVGVAPSKWNLIPSKLGHENPTKPFAVPANSWVEAPYVEWTPSVAKAHQCLMAIAYVNDDPKDSKNPDPIVYPFEMAWDSNMAARNVHVLTTIPAGGATLRVKFDAPGEDMQQVVSDLLFRLVQTPRFLTSGQIKTTVMPTIKWRINEGGWMPLQMAVQPPPTHTPVTPSLPPIFHPEPFFYEKLVAWGEKERIELNTGQPHEIDIKVEMPKRSLTSIFYLRIQQRIQGVITGAYTIAIG